MPAPPAAAPLLAPPIQLAEQPTMRDRMAMAALTGMASAMLHDGSDEHAEHIAARVWKITDAMLRARATTQGEQRGEGA